MSCPMTALGAYCHVVPFHKVRLESAQGVKQIYAYFRLQGIICSWRWRHHRSDIAVECILSRCSLIQKLVIIGSGVKEIYAYFFLQGAICSCRWRHLMSDDVIGCVVSCCSLPKNSLVISSGNKKMKSYTSGLHGVICGYGVIGCSLSCMHGVPFHKVLW